MQIKNYRWVPPSFVLIIAAAAIIGSGCGSNDITSANDIVWPDSGVSYQKQVVPFFQLSCNIPACHDIANPGGGAPPLDSWGDVHGIRVVGSVPKDTNCILCRVMKLQDPNHINIPFIPTAAETRGIVEWVKEGAPDN
jgi:hypothetical protein